ncbi:MAG: hypothetical protein GY940_07615 [bacterium]|nr:hypothetical protein [bacterium]
MCYKSTMDYNYKKALEDLKEFLQTGDEFIRIFEQFYTLTETTDFLDLGEPEENLVLGKILLKTIERVFGKLDDFETILIYLPEYGFYHGPVKVNETQGSFFYYEDITMGLVTVYDDQDEESKFMRFTGDIVPVDSFPASKVPGKDH